LILETLPLARLRFDLQATTPCDVPPHKGDLLRMALLWWLSEFWCPMPDRCRHGCREPHACMFGRIVEPPVDPAWPRSVRFLMGDSPPPAYALWDMQDRRRHLRAGEPWGFEMTLAGELALSQIPAIVAAVQQGAEQGMGRVRVQSRVCQVTVPAGSSASDRAAICLAREAPHGGETLLTWQDYRLDQIAFGYEQAARWVEAQCDGTPVRGFSLRYLSPVQIRERKRAVETPHFRPVARALVRRLRLLSQVHGAGEWPQSAYGPLLDLAETVRLEHDECFWTGYARHSRRTGAQQIDGFVGQAWYTSHADLRPLLAILWLGQWLHVGKAYVLGNGRYTIETLF
jgi:hypothetical protein